MTARALPTFRRDSLGGILLEHAVGSREFFARLRADDPTAGFDVQRVDWKASARLGRLSYRGRERRTGQVQLVLSTRQDAYADDDEFDRALSVTATFADVLDAHGQLLGLDFDGAGQVAPADIARTLTAAARTDVPADERAWMTRVIRRAGQISVIVMVVGSRWPARYERDLASRIGDIPALVVSAGPRVHGPFPVLTVGAFDDLTRVLSRPR